MNKNTARFQANPPNIDRSHDLLCANHGSAASRFIEWLVFGAKP
jgi:hypothetical protein